jgi:TonB family protein
MNPWLDDALKVSLVVLAGLLMTLLARQRSAAARHWLLAATIGCALAIPVLGRALPAWSLPLATAAPAPAAPSEETAAAVRAPTIAEQVTFDVRQSPSAFNASDIAAAIWLAGSFCCLVALLAGLVRLALLAARATPIDDGPWVAIAREIEREYGIGRPTRLLSGTHPSLLVTWGVRPARVLIPAAAVGWSSDRIRVVLRHELAHVRRGDWLVQLAGELLRILHWFNPLAWIVAARLRSESEQACDDEVLSGGVPASDYATHLLDATRALCLERAPRVPAPAMARCSRLERRFDAMLNTSAIRTPATGWFRVMTGALLLAATGVLAAAQGGTLFSGTITDSTGAPVAAAKVVLTNAATAAKHEVKTNERGQFAFVPLPAASYTFEALVPGFKKVEATVPLTGASVRRDFALALGTLSESVTIIGSRETSSAGAAPAANARPRAAEADLGRSALQRDIAACEPSTQGGRIRPPRKIKDVRPVYPPALQAAGIGGIVTMTATIGTDGMVKDYEITKSVHPELDAAAVEAVKNWQFDGTLLNCAPTEVTMTVSLKFETK